MASWSWSNLATLATPGGTITFHSGADTLVADPGRCRGLGAFEARQPVDPRGQTHGFVIHPSFLPGADLLIVAFFHITSAGGDPGWATARDALMDATYAAAKAGVGSASSTLTFTGGPTISGLKVRAYDPFAWDDRGPGAKGCSIHVVGSDLP